MAVAPSASYSLIVRLEIKNRPGMLGRVASAIGQAGGDIGAVDLVQSNRDRVIRDITINARDDVHGQEIVSRLRRLPGTRLSNVSDRTFLVHLGGKIAIQNKVPIRTRDDTLHPGRTVGMDFRKRWVASSTNPRKVKGRLADAVEGADVFIGLSVPGILTVRDLKRMSRDPIVFAMANPTPEIRPEEAQRHVRVMATGRSDYPNQINNVLCFPGFFRGLLDSRARTVNDEMKLAAARALAAAEGVTRAAHATGVARRRRRRETALVS